MNIKIQSIRHPGEKLNMESGEAGIKNLN